MGRKGKAYAVWHYVLAKLSWFRIMQNGGFAMRLVTLVTTTAALVAVCGSPASAQNWKTITQNGGYKVARVTMGGAATGIGLTCERGVAMIAVNLVRAPRRNPALLTLKNGAASGALPIIRNGATNVWAGVIKDARLLDGLATGQSVGVAVDGADYGTASLAGANAAMRTALGGCWRPAMAEAGVTKPIVTPKVTDADEGAVRAIVGNIYGWRDGRKVKEAQADDWEKLFGPRIAALHAQCEAAVENADPKANGGEGAYAVTGDQGCLGVPFLFEPVSYEAAPFIPQTRPVVRRAGPDTMESTITVPQRFREEWGSSETIRFQRIGGRWLIDEIVTTGADGAHTYSGGTSEMIAELRKIAKRPARKR